MKMKLIKKEDLKDLLAVTYTEESNLQELADKFEKIIGMRTIKSDKEYICAFFNISKENAEKEYKSYTKGKPESKQIVGVYSDNNIFIFNQKDAEELYIFYSHQFEAEKRINNSMNSNALKEYMDAWILKHGK